MFRYKTQTIKDAMLVYMRECGLETPLLEHRIVYAWEPVAGTTVAKYTSEKFIQGGILHVRLTSAGLRQNLLLEHKDLARRLNEYVGAQVISDVYFL